MHLCYIDESGTPDVTGNTSHYVLAGLSIPDNYWNLRHVQLEAVKQKYKLQDHEIHVAWMLRPYPEQQSIPGFETMTAEQRRSEVLKARAEQCSRLTKVNPKGLKETRNNYKHTEAYVHLTAAQRHQVIMDVAALVSGWGDVRLFAECIDKAHFNPAIAGKTVEEQAFEQLVSRFERYLQNTQAGYGLLIHDNNQTLDRRHTNLMKSFLQKGTLWTHITHVIETPLFVDSQLTGMVQLADLCAYALRRYIEKGEEDIFNLVFQRADRVGGASVGVRHFTRPGCECKICLSHNAPVLPS